MFKRGGGIDLDSLGNSFSDGKSDSAKKKKQPYNGRLRAKEPDQEYEIL